MHRRPPRASRSPALATLLLLGLLLAGCERQGFRFTVTFPGPLDVEEGALVRYQGIAVGGVTTVALDQSAPSKPGRVALGVVIDASDVVIREDDVFELVADGLMGDPYLRITPAEGTSPPLEPGARVAGRPPLATRVTETAEEALARLGVLAREQAQRLAETLGEQLDEEKLRADTPKDPNADATPRRGDAPAGTDDAALP